MSPSVKLKEEATNPNCTDLLGGPHQEQDRSTSQNLLKRKLSASFSGGRSKAASINGSEQTTGSSRDSSDPSSTSQSDTASDSDESESSSSSSSALDSDNDNPNLKMKATSIATKCPQHKSSITNTQNVLCKPPHSHTQVPPGHGKASTRSRNLRRRRKLQAARLGALPIIPDPPVRTSSVNIIPLGEAKYGAVQLSEQVPEGESVSTRIVSSTNEGGELVPMASLRSKNKKRGRAELKADPLPRKIVFEEDDPSAASQAAITNVTDPHSTSSPSVVVPSFSAAFKSSHLPVFIPPSERATLPPNIFVTSIDVEPASDRRKHRQSNQWLETAHDDLEVNQPVELSYDEPENQAKMHTTSNQHSATPVLDAQALIQDAQGRWDTLVPVSRETLSSITPNSILCHKV
jgi:hypothetical protein